MANLLMHCGGREVTRDDVVHAPTPERTKTWVPVAHNRLLELAQATIEAQGYSVTNEAHGLWGGGARYFGLFELANDSTNPLIHSVDHRRVTFHAATVPGLVRKFIPINGSC